MKFYEIPETKCRMHILVYPMAMKATRQKAAVHYTVHFLSRGNLKNLMPRSFTFVCQLYCCSSKRNNNKAYYVQLLQNREYLQYGPSNGKHR